MGAMSDFGDRVEAEEARTHVRGVVRRSKSSFFWAMRRMDSKRRDAMFAIYAFCREVDDVADGTAAPEKKLQELAVWRAEISNIYDGTPATNTGRALCQFVEEFSLDRADFEVIISGMETDSHPTVRMETAADLDHYMDQVACSVGRLSNCVFGIPAPESYVLAKALGEALQITNILRDIDEDAGRGRFYVPMEMLREHNVKADDVSSLLSDPRIAEVCATLAERAHGQFVAAENLLDGLNVKQARPAIMMMQAYRLLLDKLQARGWAMPREAVKPTILERLWVLLRFGFL